MKCFVLIHGKEIKLFTTLFFMLLFILQQATATTLVAQNNLREYTKDRGDYQQTRKVMRDIREYKPALNNEHMNHLLGLYGARQKRLELSPEQRNLIRKDAYSDQNEDNDENENRMDLSATFDDVAEKAARNAINNIVDESDMDDSTDKEKAWQKLDKSLFDNLKFVDVPDDKHSNIAGSKSESDETEHNNIVNEQHVDVRARKKAQTNKTDRNATEPQKQSSTQKKYESLKQGESLKVPQHASNNLKPHQKLVETAKAGPMESASSVPTQKEKQELVAGKKERNILDMTGQKEPLLIDNQEFKSINRLGTKDFIAQAQKDVDLAKKAFEIFKKVSEEIYSNKRNIRIGGLYDEYKKRLDTILQQKRSRGTSKITSDKDIVLKDVKNEFTQNETPSSGCGCNNDVAVTSSLKKAENVNREHSETAEANEHPQHQAKKKQRRPTKTQHSKSPSQTKPMMTKEKGSNTDRNTLSTSMRKLVVAKATKNKNSPTVWSNPYFLPNSKFKQTPFSEVPLKPRAGFADEPKTSDEVKSAPIMSTPCKDDAKQAKTKKLAAAKLEPYLGVNTTYIKTALQALGDVPYSSLYDEYQKQMSILNHMLRAKQRWWNEARKIGSLRRKADAQERAIVTAAFAALPMLAYSTTGHCQLVDDATSSAHIAGKCNDASKSQVKQSSGLKRRNTDAPNQTDPQVLAKAIEYTLNQATSGQSGGNLLTNAANRMNMSATELAQRLTNTTFNPFEENFAQVMKKFVDNSVNNVSSPVKTPQSGANALPSTTDLNILRPGKTVEKADGFLSVNTAVPAALNDCIANTPPATTNINNVLDKILQKLECLQKAHAHAGGISSPADNYDYGDGKTTSYCAENPTDGSPCQLTGSWQSTFLGVRFDISSINATQTCSSERQRRWWFVHKPTDSQNLKVANVVKTNDSLQFLQVYVQETVPPRRHDFMEHLREWHFDGWAANLMGGPLVMTVRKCSIQLTGTFIGYCRTCGGIDTIFGSWTFCTPTKDCQDITTAFFEKRDMLRRYKMDENRRERYKAMLFNKSSFSKKEAARMQSQRKES